MNSKKKFQGKKVTINHLAVIINNGFTSIQSEFNGVNRDITDIKGEMGGLKQDFSEIKGELQEVNTRLDRIENIILTDHRNRIERMEDKVRILETKK